MSFHHVALLVADLPRVEAFYRDVLGLAVIRRWPYESGSGDRAVWLDAGGGAFLALERSSTALGAARPPSASHLPALRIAREERAAWEARLAASGVPIYHRTPFTIFVRDPEGNPVGLSHHPEPAGT